LLMKKSMVAPERETGGPRGGRLPQKAGDYATATAGGWGAGGEGRGPSTPRAVTALLATHRWRSETCSAVARQAAPPRACAAPSPALSPARRGPRRSAR